ncbi:MAG TPA: DUF420 domain-containing protein [Myxococcota bacterium]|nr:DUF420 domain-containing protein [Myxococcota bacterium]
MDPKLIFWSWALANMALVVTLGVRGMRAIRANRIEQHRRSMGWASFFVVAFLVAYLVKRLALGGEDIGAWTRAARINLFVHEVLVVSMLLAGGAAFALGRRLAITRRVTQSGGDPLAPRETLSRHRLAGRVALACALLGFVTACGILGGMLARA